MIHPTDSREAQLFALATIGLPLVSDRTGDLPPGLTEALIRAEMALLTIQTVILRGELKDTET